MELKIGRNSLCPCGSGRKLKVCCRDFESVSKVLQLNIIYREMLIDDVLKDPQAFAHKLRNVAFHEAGHALMEMLFYRDLKRVSIIPNIYSLEGMKIWSGVCFGIDHDWKSNDEDSGVHAIEQAAIISAGEAAAALFCACDTCASGRTQDGDSDQEKLSTIPEKHRENLLSVTTTSIKRHRPQLDAIIEALLEHKTLSGNQVFDAMAATGWNPETDCDPEQFYDEFLSIEEARESRM